MSQVRTIIFSDLDGTLLDHFTYQSTPAHQTLVQLKNMNIPIVLNTSKTFAELVHIQQELSLNEPFIVENGAAVYIPVDTFPIQPQGTDVYKHYWRKSFGNPVSYWRNLLTEHASEFRDDYCSFSEHSIDSLAKLTGLTPNAANRAKQRQYGEPIEWLGDVQSYQAFVKKLTSLGAHVIQGGRFTHIGNQCDKGKAMLWLSQLYQTHVKQQTIQTIALGDGENDIAMLNAADIAVQIRSPVHDFPQLKKQQHQLQTQLYGPAGWAEAIKKLLVIKSDT